jgi:3-phenylpropionate/trans-cinnamate dioxygenase ferredoxin subunit
VHSLHESTAGRFIRASGAPSGASFNRPAVDPARHRTVAPPSDRTAARRRSDLTGPIDGRATIRLVTEILAFRPELLAPGAADARFRSALSLADLPAGSLARVSFGDLDILLAHTARGICAVDDRCPHMSAPLSIGSLNGCIVACPLHAGRFDLEGGEPVQMPTTGGLRPDGTYEPVWTPPGREPKEDPPGPKTEARRRTRVRRFRYYPVRIADGMIEVAVPA